MLEKFLEERVRRHPHADFRALDVQAAGDMRVGGQNKRVGPGHARLHDIECKVVYTGVVGRLANVRNNECHEEFLHRLLEGIKLVDCLGRFGVTADGVTGFGRVEYETVVFEGGRCKLHDSRLRINGMNFKTHGDNIDYPLTLRNDLGAFEGVLDMRKMERVLVDSCRENVKSARLVESLGGCLFLRVQEMAGGLPDLLLLGRIHAGRRVPLLVVPDGLDFHEYDCFSVLGNNVKLSALVGVVASDNLIAFAAEIGCRLGLDEISLGLVA